MTGLYTDPHVRQRLAEFLGGGIQSPATAVCLTHTDGCRYDRRDLRPAAELDWFLERHLDISRSLADTASYLLHLDMEYVNFDSPAEALVDPWRCFELQEPAVKVIESVLLELDIQPLHLMTGQGHHFVWRIGRGSPVAARIRALSPDEAANARCLGRLPPILTGSIGMQDQAFFSALGLLIEYVAHLIKERAGACCLVPVELTAVCVGPSLTAHREMISIDISEYGDPLHTRAIRLPFTLYRKPWVSGEAWMEQQVPVFPAIPLYEMDFRQAIKVRQVEEEVLDLACRACVRIPLQEEGTARLLDAYLTSRLRRFHDFFHQAQHDPPECWTGTYDRTDLESMPGCVGHLLAFPNDRLLKPSGMQMVTRYLLAKEWHPRHIAGLIRSKFENPSFGWGVDWNDYDAGTRADFYVRLFSCLYLTGLDRLVDLNCTSIQEKEYCFQRDGEKCGLESVREFLLSKLPHE